MESGITTARCMRCGGAVALLSGAVRHVFPSGAVDYEKQADHAPELRKACGCGETYGSTEWGGLPLCGYYEIERDAEEGDLDEVHAEEADSDVYELRHCSACGSTISIVVDPADVVSGAPYAHIGEKDEREREAHADLVAAGIVGWMETPADAIVRLLVSTEDEQLVAEELDRLLAVALDERLDAGLRADALGVVERVEAGRDGRDGRDGQGKRSHDSPVWHEPEGGMLEEGWYASGPHGARLGPFDTSETAWLQLRRARGW